MYQQFCSTNIKKNQFIDVSTFFLPLMHNKRSPKWGRVYSNEGE